jgi:hypothetical protein
MNSVVNNHTLRTYKRSATQKVPRPLWNQKVHYCVYKIPTPNPILREMNVLRILKGYSFKMHFNIILPSSDESQRDAFPSTAPVKILCYKDVWGSGGMASPFLTSAPDWDQWSGLRPCRSTARERAHGTHWIRGFEGRRAGLDAKEKKNFVSVRNRIPDVQPRARCYADWAIAAPT